MKIDEKAQAALQDPRTRPAPIEMTPEMKEKASRVCDEVVELLKHNTASPMEAYMILRFVQLGLEETYGIRGSIIMENADAQH